MNFLVVALIVGFIIWVGVIMEILIKGRKGKEDGTFVRVNFCCSVALLGPLIHFVLFPNTKTKPAAAHEFAFHKRDVDMGEAAGVYSIQGARPHMEDTYQAALNIAGYQKTAFFAVFDGHGGSRASEFCAAKLHELLAKQPFVERPVFSLKSIFKQLDSTWYTQSQRHNWDDGSTAISALIIGNTLFVANVGDSRAVLCSNGKAIPMSHDHKPSREDEKQRIESAGGRIIYYGTWRVEGVLAVTRAVGDRRLKRFVTAVPEIKQRRIRADDEWLILASDGVWDVMSNQEACDVIRNAKDGKEAALMLTSQSFDKGSQDNITSLVIDLRRHLSAAAPPVFKRSLPFTSSSAAASATATSITPLSSPSSSSSSSSTSSSFSASSSMSSSSSSSLAVPTSSFSSSSSSFQPVPSPTALLMSKQAASLGALDQAGRADADDADDTSNSNSSSIKASDSSTSVSSQFDAAVDGDDKRRRGGAVGTSSSNFSLSTAALSNGGSAGLGLTQRSVSKLSALGSGNGGSGSSSGGFGEGGLGNASSSSSSSSSYFDPCDRDYGPDMDEYDEAAAEY